MSGEMSSDTAYLYAYGTYLSHGGTHDGFMDLTVDEVQLIYTVTMMDKAKMTRDIVLGLAKVLGKMLGGTD